jgi:hypothetical protein
MLTRISQVGGYVNVKSRLEALMGGLRIDVKCMYLSTNGVMA